MQGQEPCQLVILCDSKWKKSLVFVIQFYDLLEFEYVTFLQIY